MRVLVDSRCGVDGCYPPTSLACRPSAYASPGVRGLAEEASRGTLVNPQSEGMMTEVGAYTVGMLELDKHLSKIAKQARKEVVLVTHRNKPWICLVSYDQWRRERHGTHRIPEGHPLIKLCDIVDPYLEKHAAELRQTAQELALCHAPEIICRALLLQLMYSLPSIRSLYENIDYNLLFRRFIGVDLYKALCAYADFERDVETLVRKATVLDLADFVACEYVGLAHADSEFRFNHALLYAWRVRATTFTGPQTQASGVSQPRMAMLAVPSTAGHREAACPSLERSTSTLPVVQGSKPIRAVSLIR